MYDFETEYRRIFETPLEEIKAVFYGTVEEAIAGSPYDKFEDAYLWYSDEEVNDNENI